MKMAACKFYRVDGGWKCGECGRVVRLASEHPPMARCRDGSLAAAGSHGPMHRPATGGPGTELKRLLAKFGIESTAGCQCNSRAAIMDDSERRSPGWCEKNIDTIVGWLREEAEKRGLPFLDAAGRVLVRRAIKNAKKLS